MIFVNGNVVGVHQRPQRFAAALRRLRRRGRIGAHTSVHVDKVGAFHHIPVPICFAARHVLLGVSSLHTTEGLQSI